MRELRERGEEWLIRKRAQFLVSILSMVCSSGGSISRIIECKRDKANCFILFDILIDGLRCTQTYVQICCIQYAPMEFTIHIETYGWTWKNCYQSDFREFYCSVGNNTSRKICIAIHSKKIHKIGKFQPDGKSLGPFFYQSSRRSLEFESVPKINDLTLRETLNLCGTNRIEF